LKFDPCTKGECHGFYSYTAKYLDENGAALKVPAELPADVEANIRDMAARAFRGARL
jgi:D-alanine-D-alanine ligase